MNARENWEEVIERAAARQRDRVRAAMSRLRLAGLPPCPRDGTWHCGCEVFWVSVRPVEDDVAELRVGASRGEGSMFHLVGAPWPEYGTRIRCSELLEALILGWRDVGRYYRKEGVAAGNDGIVIDNTVYVDSGPRLEIRPTETGLVVRTDAGQAAPASESLIVVEVLRALGDLLASRCTDAGASEVSDVWRTVRDEIRVSPFEGEWYTQDGRTRRHDRSEAVAFYASMMGQQPHEFERAALLAYIHQAEGHDDKGLWDPAVLPDNAPSLPALTERLSSVSQVYGLNPDELSEQAILTRIHDARNALYYESWKTLRKR